MQYKKILTPFQLYLKSQNSSASTVRNYSSDVRHFLDWLKNSDTKLTSPAFDDPNRISQKLSKSTLKIYKKFLQKNAVSTSTINRRLSSLRRLIAFFASQGWLEDTKAKKVPNVTSQKKQNKRSQLVDRFAKYLKSEGKSQSTVRNYVSDIKSYLDYLQEEKQVTLNT